MNELIAELKMGAKEAVFKKAELFLKHRCVYLTHNGAVVLPLNKKRYLSGRFKIPYEYNYNNTTHALIYHESTGLYSCDCQGYAQRRRNGNLTGRVDCSHQIAVLLLCRKITG